MSVVAIDRALLLEIVGVLERLAEDTSYGGVLAHDPRDYHPDRECCTDEEIAAWEDACRRAEAGEDVAIPGSYWREFADEQEAADHVRTTPGVAAVTFAGPGVLSHVNVQTWGIGTSTLRDPEMADLRDRLLAAIGDDRAR